MFWIDSQIVLPWLKTCPRNFKPFVSVRVAEIQETIDLEEFHFIKSSHNPVDSLTKGITPEDLEDWLKGPKFLRKPEEEWPGFKKAHQTTETKCVQVTATESFDEFAQDPASQTQADENPIMEHLMKSYSTFRKARKTMAYVLRFINNARTKEKNRKVISPKEFIKGRTLAIQMENLSWTSHLPHKSATALSQFQWYLGRSTCHTERPSDRKSFSTSCVCSMLDPFVSL